VLGCGVWGLALSGLVGLSEFPRKLAYGFGQKYHHVTSASAFATNLHDWAPPSLRLCSIGASIQLWPLAPTPMF
jgi:hypothetical protein